MNLLCLPCLLAQFSKLQKLVPSFFKMHSYNVFLQEDSGLCSPLRNINSYILSIANRIVTHRAAEECAGAEALWEDVANIEPSRLRMQLPQL